MNRVPASRSYISGPVLVMAAVFVIAIGIIEGQAGVIIGGALLAVFGLVVLAYNRQIARSSAPPPGGDHLRE